MPAKNGNGNPLRNLIDRLRKEKLRNRFYEFMQMSSKRSCLNFEKNRTFRMEPRINLNEL